MSVFHSCGNIVVYSGEVLAYGLGWVWGATKTVALAVGHKIEQLPAAAKYLYEGFKADCLPVLKDFGSEYIVAPAIWTGNAIADGAVKGWEWTKTATTYLAHKIADGANAFADWLEDAAEEVEDFVEDAADKVEDFVKAAAVDVKDFAEDAVDFAKDAFSDIKAEVKEFGKDAAEFFDHVKSEAHEQAHYAECVFACSSDSCEASGQDSCTARCAELYLD
jgi:gas vesicle protein